jgi:uncharacterized protein (TIGR03067 family)
MKGHLLSFVAVVLLAIPACTRSRPPVRAAAHDPVKEDLDRLQGAWRIESSWLNGRQEPEVARSVTILFHGDRFIVVDKDGNRLEETIKLLPDRNPKAIDRRDKGGILAGPGIYSLEGDTFKWCSAIGGNKVRPTSFSSEPGSRQSLMILRRQKN